MNDNPDTIAESLTLNNTPLHPNSTPEPTTPVQPDTPPEPYTAQKPKRKRKAGRPKAPWTPDKPLPKPKWEAFARMMALTKPKPRQDEAYRKTVSMEGSPVYHASRASILVHRPDVSSRIVWLIGNDTAKDTKDATPEELKARATNVLRSSNDRDALAAVETLTKLGVRHGDSQPELTPDQAAQFAEFRAKQARARLGADGVLIELTMGGKAYRMEFTSKDEAAQWVVKTLNCGSNATICSGVEDGTIAQTPQVTQHAQDQHDTHGQHET